MKKNYLALALLVSLTSGLAVAAPPDPAASPYAFELGLTQHHEVYKETARDGSKVMQETADLMGIKGSVARALGERGRVRLSAEYAFGDANYVGAYQGGAYGDLHANGLSRWLFETAAVYAYAAPEWNGFAVKGGLGYRHLVDNLQDAGEGGYKRTNKRVYAILGAEQAFQAANWTVTPSVEYKHSVWSRNESDVLGGLTHRQHGNGGELSVAFAQKQAVSPLTVRPFFRTWHVADSNVVAGTYEPKNRTSEAGVDIDWRF